MATPGSDAEVETPEQQLALCQSELNNVVSPQSRAGIGLAEVLGTFKNFPTVEGGGCQRRDDTMRKTRHCPTARGCPATQRSFMQESWIAISAARAKAHRLYGVRGWLVTLLWSSTLPMLAIVFGLSMVPTLGQMGGGSTKPVVACAGLAFPLVLIAVAFLRVRWFPTLWLAYCLLQLLATLVMGSRMTVTLAQASGGTAGSLPIMLLVVLEAALLLGTAAYLLLSRRARVTYRHEVRASDPAAVPAVFDRPSRNETPTDATDHARERAALRRVSQELSSGVLDTQTWAQVMRYHADGTDSARTAAYVRARMALLCPPAHVHPALARTLASGLGALLISLVVAGTLMAAVIALAMRLPDDATALIEMLVVGTLTLCWLAGLFAGARFLRAVA